MGKTTDFIAYDVEISEADNRRFCIMRVPIAAVELDDKEINSVVAVLKSGWLVQGEKVKELEYSVSKYLGVKHAIAVSSGTLGLQVMMMAAGLRPGDKVIIPAYSFIATVHAVVNIGCKPIFVDIDPVTYNIDIDLISNHIDSRTKAVLSVDTYGVPVDFSRIRQICDKFDLKFLSDSACSFGSRYDHRFVGSQADAHLFSFYPSKSITSGEGGIVVTNDDQIYTNSKHIRNQGYSDFGNTFTEFVVVGTNARMSDIHAAIACEQLNKLDKFISARQTVANTYTSVLSSISTIQLPYHGDKYIGSNQVYNVVLLPTSKLDRDELIVNLFDLGISASRGNVALHKQKCYIKKYGGVSCPNAEYLQLHSLNLPIFPSLTLEQQSYVIESFMALVS